MSKFELWLILMDLFTHHTFQVWCKVKSYPKPFRVRICQNAQVIDIVEAAIQKEKLQTTSSFVNVKFEGEELMPGAQISQYSTSDGNPLLLELLEPQGKLHAVWCRKQIRSGEAIGSRYGSINIKCACKARTY